KPRLAVDALGPPRLLLVQGNPQRPDRPPVFNLTPEPLGAQDAAQGAAICASRHCVLYGMRGTGFCSEDMKDAHRRSPTVGGSGQSRPSMSLYIDLPKQGAIGKSALAYLFLHHPLSLSLYGSASPIPS